MTKSKAERGKGKRIDRAKEATGTCSTPSSEPKIAANNVSSCPSGVTPPVQQHQAPASKPLSKPCFTTEIQNMMFALGDCRSPSPESALLVEDIIHQQMMRILHKTSEISIARGARFITIEDFLFLLRKDKDKLQRLLRFLSFKDLKNKVSKQASVEEEDGSAPTTDAGETKQSLSKRCRVAHEFLSTIDQTGELSALCEDEDYVDEVKQERLERADRQTTIMDLHCYQEYTEARQVNFYKKATKFKDWLDYSSLEVKPNPYAMEILSYLAYETVAQIVDLSLLVKRDMESYDPFSRVMTPACSSNISAPSQSSLLPSGTDPPQPSPPTTPTSPALGNVMAAPFLASSRTSTSTPPSLGASHNALPPATSNLKSKVKKRKKSGTPFVQADFFAGNAIKPVHIREAMRRYYRLVGPMAPFTQRGVNNNLWNKFLSC